MSLLVPAHPCCPGQIPQSRKTVVCVCVCGDVFITLQYAVIVLCMRIPLLQVEAWEEAIKSCNSVLRVQPNNVKAHFRKAKASTILVFVFMQ